jgi:hypothetical protein
MPANWRGNCHATGRSVPSGGEESSCRDSEAAVMHTTPYCATIYSALKRLTSEECQREKNKCVKRGVSHTCPPSGTNAQYVLCETPEAKPTPSLAAKTWSEKRSVGWCFMPIAPRCLRMATITSTFRRGRIVNGESRQREANESDSSLPERSARAATRWLHGRDRPARRGVWRRSVRPIWHLPVRSDLFPSGETERSEV